jgi:hypothetical protein
VPIPPITSIFRASKGNEHSAPKTVLGFYAGLLALLEAGVIASLVVLASQDDLHYLIPWVAGFGGVVFVGIVGVVVAINVVDPTKLQLGQVTGREFIDYQQITRGDSIGGDYIESPAAVPSRTSIPAATVNPQPQQDEEAGDTDPVLPAPGGLESDEGNK